MSADLVIVELTLDDLLEAVEREHTLVIQGLRGVIEHAVAAGSALLTIQARVPEGEWCRWVRETLPFSETTANDYIRAAHFSEYLAEHGIRTLEDARTILRGKRRHEHRPGRLGMPDVAEEARRLAADGVTTMEIARRLGVAKSSVYWWTRPDAREAYNRRRSEANEALRRQADRDKAAAVRRAVRKVGGARAEAYAMAERMQDVLGQAHREAEDSEARAALSLAGEHYRKMRDEIVRALGAA